MEKGLPAPFILIHQTSTASMFLDPDQPIETHHANLPHWQQEESTIFLTWRLADSLPTPVITKILDQKKAWEENHPKPWDEETLLEFNRIFTSRFETLLDDCHGSCCLRNPSISKIVGDALLHFNELRYFLDSFVVMPNHVHVLFRIAPSFKLEDIMHSWRSFTANQINKTLNRTGTLWQAEYWDRIIRSHKHLEHSRNYIQQNPAKFPPGTFLLWRRGFQPLSS
jgi:REP element-mobilizing transposase RayT